MQSLFCCIFNGLRKNLAGLCCPRIFLYIWIPSDMKVQGSFIHASCCEKQNKIKLLISAQSTCQRQFPSPTHSDIKLVTFSPTVQSPPFQVCEGFFYFYFFYFYFIALPHANASMFSLKTFLFALYISALSPFCPLFFNMSIFLSLFISFSPNLSLSHFSRSILAWLCRRSSPLPCDKSGGSNSGARSEASVVRLMR